MKPLLFSVAPLAIGCAILFAQSTVRPKAKPAAPAGVPNYTYQVVHTYPHDRNAFTEGLEFHD